MEKIKYQTLAKPVGRVEMLTKKITEIIMDMFLSQPCWPQNEKLGGGFNHLETYESK